MSSWQPPPHLANKPQGFNAQCYNCKRLKHDHIDGKCPFGSTRFIINSQFIKRDIDGEYGGQVTDWWACGACGKTSHSQPAKDIEPCRWCGAENRVVPNR